MNDKPLESLSVEELALKLPPMWAEFGQHYAKTGNALQSYKKARPHVTEGSAKVRGHWIKRKPIVLTYINKLRERATGRTMLSLEERRELLSRVARGERVVDSVTTRTRQEGNMGESEEITEITEKTMSVRDALKLDSELSGDLDRSTRVDVAVGVASLLSQIGHDDTFTLDPTTSSPPDSTPQLPG